MKRRPNKVLSFKKMKDAVGKADDHMEGALLRAAERLRDDLSEYLGGVTPDAAAGVRVEPHGADLFVGFPSVKSSAQAMEFLRAITLAEFGSSSAGVRPTRPMRRFILRARTLMRKERALTHKGLGAVLTKNKRGMFSYER